MSTERVDVLAVMDSVASAIHRPAEGMVSIAHHELADFIQARAAVAELIEAAKRARRRLRQFDHVPSLEGAARQLESALARIGAP